MSLTLKTLQRYEHISIKSYNYNFFLLFVALTDSRFSPKMQKKISIKKEKVSLKEALTEIEKQTKMSVAYNESQLGADKTISLNVVDADNRKSP